MVSLRVKTKEFFCIGCGYIAEVATIWLETMIQRYGKIDMKCPVCTATDKWTKVTGVSYLGGGREQIIERLRKKHGIPEDLWKKILISRYGPAVFQGRRWKLSPLYKKMFEIDEKDKIRQKFNVVTGKDYDEKTAPVGLELDLSNPKTKEKILKKYGVKLIRR